MDPLFRAKDTPFNLRFWLLAVLGWALVIGACALLDGCSTPGSAGFRELARENAKERTALKAVAVHSTRITQHADRIGQHATAAQKFAGLLESTTLTKQQTDWLEGLRLELKAVQDENTALKLENGSLKLGLAGAQTVVTQRDATIRQTKAEVAAAQREAFFARLWLRIEWFFLGALTLFVAQVALRVCKGGMKLAAAVAVI